MKVEKSNGIFFAVLFGLMGLTLLILAWLIPVNASNRIIAAVVGSAGLFGAAVRIPTLRRNTDKESSQLAVNVEVEKES
jgi:FtsH-binding integral membrane protein